MDLTPSVVLVAVVVVAVSFVLIRWGRRREAAPPVDAPPTPGRRPAMAARDEGGNDALVNWLLDRATEQTGVALADDALARDRIAQAAVKAMEDLRAYGTATISLPFLVADAQGPKHFDVEFKQNVDSTFELRS